MGELNEEVRFVAVKTFNKQNARQHGPSNMRLLRGLGLLTLRSRKREFAASCGLRMTSAQSVVLLSQRSIV